MFFVHQYIFQLLLVSRGRRERVLRSRQARISSRPNGAVS
jgi:hypothetical protein